MTTINDQDTSTNAKSMEYLSEKFESSDFINYSCHSKNENTDANEKHTVDENVVSSTIIVFHSNSNINNNSSSSSSRSSSIKKRNSNIQMCTQLPTNEESLLASVSASASEVIPTSEMPTNMTMSISVPSIISSSVPSFSLSGESNNDENVADGSGIEVVDDNDTVSSLDSNEDHVTMNQAQAPPGTQRSIFGNYWKNTIHEESNSTSTSTRLSQSPSCSFQKDDTNHSPQTLQTSSTSISSFIMHSQNFTATSTSTMISASKTMSRCSREAAMPLPDEFTYQEFNRDFNSGRQDCIADEYEEILKNNEIGRTTLPHSTSLKDVNVNIHGDVVENDVNVSNHHHCHPTDLEVSSRVSHKSNSSITNLSGSSNNSPRSLFRNKYPSSSPSLCYGYRDMHSGFFNTNYTVRKTASASSLTRKKKASILRSRSCSLDSTGVASIQSSSTSKLSVSFDAKVFVHEYEKPKKRYTNNGWSKFFTY